MPNDQGLIEKINQLKEEKDAVIIAHNYQIPEIQDLADMIGDSLELAKKAKKVEKDIIVFCGVTFMAETAKIINPDKMVLIPEKTKCPMAAMVDPEGLREYKKKYPEAMVVAYVNTTSEIKAMSDICVTSSNAEEIVRKVDAEEIIFIPDQNLGQYVASRVPEKDIHIYPGYCVTHNTRITREMILEARKQHPNALVLAHPECKPKVLEEADGVESTGGMVRFVGANDADEFIIGTEKDMAYRLKSDYPEKKFYPVQSAVCDAMKKITLESLFSSLKEEKYEIEVAEDIRKSALAPVEKMLEMSG